MKMFLKYLRSAVILAALMLVLCGLAYPAALTGLGQAIFPNQANGSLITADGKKTADPKKAVGSSLVGQDFSGDRRYFQCRVSGVNYNTYTEKEKEDGTYGGVASGGSNLGPTSKELKVRTEKSVNQFRKEHPEVKRDDIPTDLLTASGSGLDPDITPQSAEIQVPEIAKATGISEGKLKQIVEDNTAGKVLGIFGHERVNVLKCNLEIAAQLGER